MTVSPYGRPAGSLLEALLENSSIVDQHASMQWLSDLEDLCAPNTGSSSPPPLAQRVAPIPGMSTTATAAASAHSKDLPPHIEARTIEVFQATTSTSVAPSVKLDQTSEPRRPSGEPQDSRMLGARKRPFESHHREDTTFSLDVVQEPPLQRRRTETHPDHEVDSRTDVAGSRTLSDPVESEASTSQAMRLLMKASAAGERLERALPSAPQLPQENTASIGVDGTKKGAGVEALPVCVPRSGNKFMRDLILEAVLDEECRTAEDVFNLINIDFLHRVDTARVALNKLCEEKIFECVKIRKGLTKRWYRRLDFS